MKVVSRCGGWVIGSLSVVRLRWWVTAAAANAPTDPTDPTAKRR